MAVEEMSAESVLDVIRRRRSWRNYTSKEIEPEKLRRLNDLLLKLNSGPFGSTCRFELIDVGFEGIGKVLGTYGVIRGAKKFIVGAVNRCDYAMEDYGYLFQQIVLLATEMELGTCWVGGTFNRGMFADRFKLKKDEITPAVSPVGYVSSKSSIVDQVFRFGAGSKNRKLWSELFFDSDFMTPLTQPGAGEYQVILEMVRLGPSASNKQPWRIVRHDDCYHLYLQRTKRYGKMNNGTDLQRIDMGIAMCHFELAANEVDVPGKWVQAEIPEIGLLPEDTSYVASWMNK